MTDVGTQIALEDVYEPEGFPCCAFCGSEVPAAISSPLNEAHEKIAALGLSEPGSAEFEELLAWARGFVGE